MNTLNQPDISVVIVSYNTRELLRECLNSLNDRSQGLSKEVFVVDNVSRDGSADMVAQDFPDVHLIRSQVNLGFAAANNRAFPLCQGRYVVLLNSDAFLHEGAMQRAVRYMDADPKVGLGGARLVGRDGSWQPSSRMFPSFLNDFLSLSGLAARYPSSRFFGRFDRTWADPNQPADVDWVPGAFSIIRRDALDKSGPFDEQFFLYYEEVDLCRRIKEEGFLVRYWPDVVVTHLGGESSKTVTSLALSHSGSQLTLWRMRSALIYYRKHHGIAVWFVKEMELVWHALRAWKNRRSDNPDRLRKAEDSSVMAELMQQAWHETAGGGYSPARPW